MTSKKSQSIEVVTVERHHTDFRQSIDNIDPMQLFHLSLAIFAIVTGIKNLLRYIKKLTKGKSDRKNYKLKFQIVGAIFAILKAIEQLLDSLDNPNDEE
jgi:GTP1/Obg family GTP-binding protein